MKIKEYEGTCQYVNERKGIKVLNLTFQRLTKGLTKPQSPFLSSPFFRYYLLHHYFPSSAYRFCLFLYSFFSSSISLPFPFTLLDSSLQVFIFTTTALPSLLSWVFYVFSFFLLAFLLLLFFSFFILPTLLRHHHRLGFTIIVSFACPVVLFSRIHYSFTIILSSKRNCTLLFSHALHLKRNSVCFPMIRTKER